MGDDQIFLKKIVKTFFYWHQCLRLTRLLFSVSTYIVYGPRNAVRLMIHDTMTYLPFGGRLWSFLPSFLSTAMMARCNPEWLKLVSTQTASTSLQQRSVRLCFIVDLTWAVVYVQACKYKQEIQKNSLFHPISAHWSCPRFQSWTMNVKTAFKLTEWQLLICIAQTYNLLCSPILWQFWTPFYISALQFTFAW